MNRTEQAKILTGFGAAGKALEELLRYVEHPFELDADGGEIELPLPDEPFVACWEAWAEEAADRGAFPVLREQLPQLAFPLRSGMREDPAYRAATLKGLSVDELDAATGLQLAHPERLELHLHTSPAGRIPVLLVRGREEFVRLVQALTRRNEPEPVPDSQGAAMVAGYNNWARIRALKERWEHTPEAERETATWQEEFTRIVPRKELYQDRFILLSDGPYSAVSAEDLELSGERWRELSLLIRRDHECTHYFTRRLFGAMRNNMLDELLADYAGLDAALGSFRADWFCRFIGLEEFPRYRPGGRLDIYRGDPPLSEEAFAVLQRLIHAAAGHLEDYDALRNARVAGAGDLAVRLAALACLGLTELAAPDAVERIEEAVEGVRKRIRWQESGEDHGAGR